MRTCLLVCALLLTACASEPYKPPHELSSRSQVDRHAHYLAERAQWENRLADVKLGQTPEEVHAAVERGTGANFRNEVLTWPEHTADCRTTTAPEGYQWFDLAPDWRFIANFQDGRCIMRKLAYRGQDRDLKRELGDTLCRVLPLIDAVFDAPTYAECFNSIALIRAVNALQRLGKTDAIRVLRARQEWVASKYGIHSDQRASNWWEYDVRVFLVCHLLFVHPDGDESLPEFEFGYPGVWPKEGSSLWPLFPLAVIGDVPLCVTTGYGHMGPSGETTRQRLDWCETYCNVRTEPLAPKLDPVAAAEKLLASSAWQDLDKPHPWFRKSVQEQALYAIHNCYDPQERWARTSGDASWTKHREAVAKLNLRWNAASQDFEPGK